MKSVYQDMREDQLRRKLELYLGSQKDWLDIYADWCAGMDVSETEAHQDHNIAIFVNTHRQGRVA